MSGRSPTSSPVPASIIAALATARSIPIAQALSKHFADPEKQKEIGEVSIKISGCINACGHHHVGNIGILGLEKKGVESYQITIGGDPSETYALGELFRPRPARGIRAGSDRQGDRRLSRASVSQGETFIEAYRRLGLDPFKAAFKEIADAVA